MLQKFRKENGHDVTPIIDKRSFHQTMRNTVLISHSLYKNRPKHVIYLYDNMNIQKSGLIMHFFKQMSYVFTILFII